MGCQVWLTCLMIKDQSELKDANWLNNHTLKVVSDYTQNLHVLVSK